VTTAHHHFQWHDSTPSVSVQESEYKRLLGFPAAYEIEGRARELADWARDWYSKNGRPWVFARNAESLAIGGEALSVNNIQFASRRLREQLAEAHASRAALVAVSAGPECETHARQLWQEDKPDEYFFLEIYGSAVVEHLVTQTGARLCAWADEHGLAVLPHYSPGYTGWEMADQVKLLALLRQAPGFPAPLDALETGMLRPKKSLLALFGLTDRLDLARNLATLIPCENCSFTPCQFRRAPFKRSTPQLEDVRRLQPTAASDDAHTLSQNAKYSIHPRALRKWAEQRLELKFHPDGGVDAFFRYEGTTCSNMGRPLQYDYRIRLGPPARGYPVLGAECAPAPGDVGHTFQCEYLDHPGALAKNIGAEKPLLNQPLNNVLSWPRAYSPAGCYCEAASRAHKWGLVYEVIHFALVQRASHSPK
jgi:hypothetical protein